MNKDEIKKWLLDDAEKSDRRIEEFLFSEINSADFKESWHKHYFLEDLKSPSNGFSKRVLKTINNVQKEIDGVPMWKRYVAAIIDFTILGLIGSQTIYINVDNRVLSFCIYLLYFGFSIYKFETTPGLYCFKLRVKFNDNNFLFLTIILREVLFFSLATGIGFIFYLIHGPYWDKMTGARVVWAKSLNTNL